MPWGNSPAQKAARKRYLEKMSEINQKAKELHKNTIKKLSDNRKGMYSGIFFHIYLTDFCRAKRKLKPIVIIVLMIIDFYEVFVYSQLPEWGLTVTDDEMTHFLRRLRKEKFIDRIQNKRANYFLTLKSRNLLDEFYKYYDDRRKAQLKKNAEGHKKLVVYLSRGDILRLKQDNIVKGVKLNRVRGW